MFTSPLKGKNAMTYLRGRFGDVATISTREFREFIGFSMSTDVRMRKNGQYPPVIRMPGGQKNARIFLEDVAAWIEQGGCQIMEEVKEYKGKKRGRPIGSKNRKKEQEQKNSSVLIEQDAEDQDQVEQNQDEDQDDSSNSQMTPKF